MKQMVKLVFKDGNSYFVHILDANYNTVADESFKNFEDLTSYLLATLDYFEVEWSCPFTNEEVRILKNCELCYQMGQLL